MDPGKILLAHAAGDYVIRLTGDVRLTLCTTLENCLQAMFADSTFVSVTVDVRQAQCLDSTTLGLLAKISFMAQKVMQRVPSIISDNPDITRLLLMMGFNGPIFILIEDMPCELQPLAQQQAAELPPCQCDEQQAQERVIEAHRILMSLNQSNHEQFKDLVAALEQSERLS